MTAASKAMPCDQTSVTVSQADLPLCCPMPDKMLWNAHPRVYLPIAAAGKVLCPYCSTEYILED